MSRPVVGIACDVRVDRRVLHFVFAEYVQRIEAAGGDPVLIPPSADPATAVRQLARVDALVIPGGEDLDPRLYGEEPLSTQHPVSPEREAFDLALGRAALESDRPVLGICYGCQLLAVVSGGALWQHIPTQVDTPELHAGKFPDLPEHPIDVESGSRLHALLGGERVTVNSAHHQAPKRVGAGLRITAKAPDGVIEGFEAEGERFLLGVEWHPELMEDEAQRRLFAGLVDAAR